MKRKPGPDYVYPERKRSGYTFQDIDIVCNGPVPLPVLKFPELDELEIHKRKQEIKFWEEWEVSKIYLEQNYYSSAYERHYALLYGGSITKSSEQQKEIFAVRWGFLEYIKSKVLSETKTHLFTVACFCDNIEIATFMFARCRSDMRNLNDTLAVVCQLGYINVIKFLIKKGAKELNKGLVNACSNGHIEVVKYLLKKNAMGFKRGIYLASSKGYTEIVEILLSRRVGNLDKCLSVACENGHIDTVAVLIKCGASNCKCGKTPKEHN